MDTLIFPRGYKFDGHTATETIASRKGDINLEFTGSTSRDGAESYRVSTSSGKIAALYRYKFFGSSPQKHSKMGLITVLQVLEVLRDHYKCH